MAKTFTDKELVPVMAGTKCRGCRENINLGVLKYQLDDGTLIFYCKRCHVDSERRGGKAY